MVCVQGSFGLAMFIQLAHQRNAFCLQFAKSVAQLKPHGVQVTGELADFILTAGRYWPIKFTGGKFLRCIADFPQRIDQSILKQQQNQHKGSNKLDKQRDAKFYGFE